MVKLIFDLYALTALGNILMSLSFDEGDVDLLDKGRLHDESDLLDFDFLDDDRTEEWNLDSPLLLFLCDFKSSSSKESPRFSNENDEYEPDDKLDGLPLGLKGAYPPLPEGLNDLYILVELGLLC